MICNKKALETFNPLRQADDVLRELKKLYLHATSICITDRRKIIRLDKAAYIRGGQTIITSFTGQPLERDDIEADIDTYGQCNVILWSYPISSKVA